MNRKNHNKKAFTVVELVIVIAVIAILAAVLIPTFVNLVKKANESQAQVEAKNLITEMLTDILTREDRDADLLVFSHKGEDVYLYGYSQSEGRVLEYSGAELAKFTGSDFKAHVKDTLLEALVANGSITEVSVDENSWRYPDKTADMVNDLGNKGDMVVYANYTIIATKFASGESLSHKAYIGGVGYDSIEEAIENCKDGETIVLASAKDGISLTTTKETTLTNVTFKAADGAVVNGMKLVGSNSTNDLTMENVTFDGITFTDQVCFGQSGSSYGYSKCSNVTFKNCNFDLTNSKEKYKDAIKRGDVRVSGDIASKEETAYIVGLTIENCTFKNVRYAVTGGKVRNVSIKNCTVENASDYAFNFGDAAGSFTMEGNTVDNAKGVLQINTVCNNYSTTDPTIIVNIRNNTATNMTCDNGLVFYTGFDNARAVGDSIYKVIGNKCTYTQTFDEPLCGFKIKSNYGPSKVEFVPNTDN